jgi:hypothetical protein
MSEGHLRHQLPLGQSQGERPYPRALRRQLWAWGIWGLAIAALALWAGYSLLGGGSVGRVVAYIWAVLVIVNGLLIIGVAPWFAAAMIAPPCS